MTVKQILQRLLIAAFASVVVGLATLEATFLVGPEHLVARFDPPGVIGLKTGDLSANLNGERGVFGRLHDGTVFRANNGGWRAFVEKSPRLSSGAILLEVPSDQLIPGLNEVEVVFTSFLGLTRQINVPFEYAPEPVSFPISWDWSRDMAEVQDGVWERRETAEGWRLGPVEGAEGYDRLVLVAPPFDGPRRVTVDVTFRKNTGRPFGFGVIPLWGGHNDPDARSPRRGWEYAIAWYYDVQNGFGVELSRKDGARPHTTVRKYDARDIVEGETYRIIAEARGPLDVTTGSAGYSLRMQWAHPASGQISDWIELTDASVPVTDQPHAVALVAHRAAVDFGPVFVERIKP
ncbi:hypothetical protein [Tropicimonas sp. S265A]|uniref:hypothetical protein n=1 Tax=Tropicimonas sp. S265A TaxID=3415134 RepID=UPI003C7E3232